MTQKLCRISGDDAIRGNVFRDCAPGADDGILSHRKVGEDGCSRTNRSALLDHRSLDFPVGFSLQVPVRCGSRIAVVNKRDTVPDENIVFDGHAFTYEGVAGDFAALPNFGVLLNFNKGADLGLIAHFASVQVDELRKPDALSQLYVWRNAVV